MTTTSRRNGGPISQERKHTIAVLVENKFGVLARIAGLFSGRGYNIHSLTVGETQDSAVSRMTIVSSGDEKIIEQILKQLERLVEVIKVEDLTEEDFVDREMALVKVNAQADVRAEVLRITDIFRGNIVDVSPSTYTIEITGDSAKVDALIGLLRPIGICEIARTGKAAMSRGVKMLQEVEV